MKHQWVVVTIGLILFLIFIPRSILYPDYRAVGWAILVIIFVVLPYSVFKLSGSLGIVSRNWRFSLACLTPLIVGPSFGLYHQYKEKKELERHGQWTTGVVIDTNWHRGTSGIKCLYVVDNKRFETSYESDYEDRFDIGDTLRIIYSSDFPKIYELEYNWETE